MKRLLTGLLSVILLFVLSFGVCATEEMEKEISDRIFTETDDRILDILEDFGIDSLDFESIYSVSLKNVLLYFKDSLKGFLKKNIKLFTEIFSVIILAGTVSLVTEEKKYKNILNILLIPVITLMLVDEINLCLSSALSLLKLNGSFMLSFVPIYAVVIAAAGNPATALTYNTVVLGYAELISAVINYGLVDIIGCFFCLSIGFSVNRNINFARFISTVNRFVSFILGLVSSVFASVLTVKGIFASSADSVTAKGIRFTIGSLIPVIGSAISEAYSTLLGSIGVLKNSVAIIGILAVVLINIPVVAELLIINIGLNSLSFICELYDCTELSDVLKAFACGIKIIGLLVIFEAFILIITTAIMLTVKGG